MNFSINGAQPDIDLAAAIEAIPAVNAVFGTVTKGPVSNCRKHCQAAILDAREAHLRPDGSARNAIVGSIDVTGTYQAASGTDEAD